MKPEDNDEAVPIALAVIEHTLQFLSEGGEAENDGEDEAATVKSEGLRKWVDMDPQRLLQLKRDLDEAVDAMFIYLEDLREAGSLNDALVLPICRSQISPSCPARWPLPLYSAVTAFAHCTQSCRYLHALCRVYGMDTCMNTSVHVCMRVSARMRAFFAFIHVKSHGGKAHRDLVDARAITKCVLQAPRDLVP